MAKSRRGVLLSLETKRSQSGHCEVTLEYSGRKSDLKLVYSRFWSESAGRHHINPVDCKPPYFSRETFNRIQKSVKDFYNSGLPERIVYQTEISQKKTIPPMRIGGQYGLI